jgi:hypothetical protein
MTTVDGRTVPTTFAHRDRPIPKRTLAMNGSSVDRFWVACSTSTNARHETAAQRR